MVGMDLFLFPFLASPAVLVATGFGRIAA